MGQKSDPPPPAVSLGRAERRTHPLSSFCLAGQSGPRRARLPAAHRRRKSAAGRGTPSPRRSVRSSGTGAAAKKRRQNSRPKASWPRSHSRGNGDGASCLATMSANEPLTHDRRACQRPTDPRRSAWRFPRPDPPTCDEIVGPCDSRPCPRKKNRTQRGAVGQVWEQLASASSRYVVRP